MPARTQRPGLGTVDFQDPTENVKALALADSKRQDDLRALTRELMDAQIDNVRVVGELRAKHQRELDRAESERLNAIRQVDREDVSQRAAEQQQAITTLATTTNTLAETLRSQVAIAAQQQEARLQALSAEMVKLASDNAKRITALEQQAAGQLGKQTVADPAQAEAIAEIRSMMLKQATGAGKAAGIGMVGTVAAAVLASLLSLGAFVYEVTRARPVVVAPPETTSTVTTTAR